jgi:hypothetical protein
MTDEHVWAQVRKRRSYRTARALGWFSLGLGAVELMIAREVARASGLGGQEMLVRACGVREIATGIAILAARNPAPFILARVAGDAMDLTVLDGQAAGSDARAGCRTSAMAAVLGVGAVDVACARGLLRDSETARRLHRYHERSGFPKPAQQMRGAARADFQPPLDMRVPAALRPYGSR